MSPITQAKLLLSFFALTTGLIGSCLVPKGAWASASEPPCEKKGEAPEIKTGISLEDLVARIQAKTCAFPGIEKKAFDQGQSEAQVFIQVGFVDEPSEKAPLKSYDSEILSAIEEHFLKDCPFKRESANSISLKYPSGFTLRLLLGGASSKGAFRSETSAENLALIGPRMQKSQYFVYIGHSRYGRGMDLYPWDQYRGKNAVPIYGKKFYSELPQSIQGVALIGCDSNSHASRQGALESATKKGIRFYAQEQEVFNLQNSLNELEKALRTF